ncbi:MAG: alpha/beta hydrolase [Caldilineaceae bacterium]
MSQKTFIHSGPVELVAESFGAGPWLIFAHGLTGTRQGVKQQFALLAAQYRIVVFNQRGHGESTPIVEPAKYVVEEMADDIGAVMDAYGIERAVVGGESMGAATALSFALRHPERVSHLLLTAPAFGDTINSERERFQQLAEGIATFGIERFLIAARHTWEHDFHWPPDVIEAVASNFSAHKQDSLIAALRGVMQWTPLPDPTVLRTLTCPTCIISWENDPLHPATLASRFASLLPHATVVNMAPLPTIFQQPDLVGDIYGEFLARS